MAFGSDENLKDESEGQMTMVSIISRSGRNVAVRP